MKNLSMCKKLAMVAGAVLALSGCTSNAPAPYEDRGQIRYTKDVSTSSVYAQSTPVPEAPTLSQQQQSGTDIAKTEIVESTLAPVPTAAVQDGAVLHHKERYKPDSYPEDGAVEGVAPNVATSPQQAHIQQQRAGVPTVDRSSSALELEYMVEERNQGDVVENYKISSPLGMQQFQWPVYGKVVSRYGKQGTKFNEGIDILAPAGTKVVAIGDGTVVYLAENIEGYGNLIIIKHGSDIMSAYAHLEHIIVKRNQVVKGGQQLGVVGTAGSANAPQLHFSVRKGKKTVNPEADLKTSGATSGTSSNSPAGNKSKK
jgi:lipoprotein NlpD